MIILNRNESGMVLVTVIAVIIALSVLALSYISQNLNQSSATQSQVDAIKSHELTIGSLSKLYSDLNGGVAPDLLEVPPAETLDGKVFTPQIDQLTVSASDVSYTVQTSY